MASIAARICRPKTTRHLAIDCQSNVRRAPLPPLKAIGLESSPRSSEQAAKHHHEAAKHHKAGNHEKAAHHSKVAHGHHLHATEHHEHASKKHAEKHG
jgi:hypothetical protein